MVHNECCPACGSWSVHPTDGKCLSCGHDEVKAAVAAQIKQAEDAAKAEAAKKPASGKSGL